jgi:hypothetical protein
MLKKWFSLVCTIVAFLFGFYFNWHLSLNGFVILVALCILAVCSSVFVPKGKLQILSLSFSLFLIVSLTVYTCWLVNALNHMPKK